MRISGWLIAALLLCWAGMASAAPDTIYLNGKVWTGTSDTGFVQAFAVKGERIVAVGDDRTIRPLARKGTKRVDLKGRLVTPGFIDNHTHFLGSSLALGAVNLRDAASPAEFAARIAARARERPGEWILDGMWDHELWGGALPRRDWIDAATGDTPVFVSRLDGHMALANSAALKRAGISAGTPDPPGGTIVRDAAGVPTGLLKDAAMGAVQKVIPPPSAEQVDAALARGFAHALSHGVTQVHDMGWDWVPLEAFRRARVAGRLPIRVYAFVPISGWVRLAEFVRREGRGDDWLRWGGVKGFVDGSLGSTTAWFHAPYRDMPETSGLTVTDPAALAQMIRGAHRAGLQLAVHAIGDRANDWLLDTYAKVGGAAVRRARFRIEHAQHMTRAAIARAGAMEIIPSMQPYHAIDDGRWAEKRLGPERLKDMYAFRSLLAAGAPLTFGSDWSVAPLDPIAGIDAAVNRRTIDGRNPKGWQPQERVTVADALRAYTAANAYAGFQEDRLGRIVPGQLADFVVLSQDIFTIDPARIGETKVLRAVVGGRQGYAAPGA
ncbi:MAG: amidohydrolase [Pseudomonadota bacterium]|nr:amidohydrolase [Pseudomonadota bacterium]